MASVPPMLNLSFSGLLAGTDGMGLVLAGILLIGTVIAGWGIVRKQLKILRLTTELEGLRAEYAHGEARRNDARQALASAHASLSATQARLSLALKEVGLLLLEQSKARKEARILTLRLAEREARLGQPPQSDPLRFSGMGQAHRAGSTFLGSGLQKNQTIERPTLVLEQNEAEAAHRAGQASEEQFRSIQSKAEMQQAELAALRHELAYAKRQLAEGQSKILELTKERQKWMRWVASQVSQTETKPKASESTPNDPARELENPMTLELSHLERLLDELSLREKQLVQQSRVAALGKVAEQWANAVDAPMQTLQCGEKALEKRLISSLQTLAMLSLDLEPKTIRLLLLLLENSVAQEMPPSPHQNRAAAADRTSPEQALLEKTGLQGMPDKYLPLFQHPQASRIAETVLEFRRVWAMLHKVGQATESIDTLATAMKGFAADDPYGKPQWVYIQPNIRAALALFRHELGSKIILHENLGADLPPVECFPGLLSLLWAQLLRNALESLQGTGELWLEASTTEASPVLEVRLADSGPGIPPRLLPKIFDPLSGPGIDLAHPGVGLDLCQQIVRQHGGTIAVESRPGRTTFTVRLPFRLPEKGVRLPNIQR